MTWQVQTAKNKLSQLIDDSVTQGPQIISRRGKNTAVVISYAEYMRTHTEPKQLKDIVRDYEGPEMPEIIRGAGRAQAIDFNNLID